MPTLDPILVAGIIASIGISVLLVLLGIDRAQGLIIVLLGTILTLIVDLVARLRDTEAHILDTVSLGLRIARDEWLFDIIEQIVTDSCTV